MMLRDDLMALDYLASRPEVDARRIGVTGMSMGATRSWWLMALDERIKTGVAVACLTRYQNLIEHEMLKAHGIYYFVPNLLNHFDTEAVVALLAPRPALFHERRPGRRFAAETASAPSRPPCARRIGFTARRASSRASSIPARATSIRTEMWAEDAARGWRSGSVQGSPNVSGPCRRKISVDIRLIAASGLSA